MVAGLWYCYTSLYGPRHTCLSIRIALRVPVSAIYGHPSERCCWLGPAMTQSSEMAFTLPYELSNDMDPIRDTENNHEVIHDVSSNQSSMSKKDMR